MATRKKAALADSGPKRQESRIGKKQLPVWVTEAVHHELKGLAHAQHRSLEDIVVELVEGYLRKHKKL